MTRIVVGGSVVDASPQEAGSPRPIPDHLSFSQIKKLSKRYARHCARAWAYDKLAGLEWRPGTSMICGRCVDDAIRVMFTTRMRGGTEAQVLAATTAAIEASIEEADWPASANREGYTRVINEAVMALYEELIDVIPDSVQEEHKFRLKDNASDDIIEVIGYSDWILGDGTIVDLKFSGSNHWNNDNEWDMAWLADKRDQLTLYWMARMADARRLSLPEPAPEGRVTVASHSLKRKTPVVRSCDFHFDAIDQVEMIAAIREAYAAQRAQCHPPSPGEGCALCSYQERCVADSAAFAVPTNFLLQATSG
jgi:PD-(D/E)XK nuclease superfamily